MPIRIDVGPSSIVFIIILHYYPLSIAYNYNYTNPNYTHSTQHNTLYSTLNSIHAGTYNNSHMNGYMGNVRYFPPMYYGSV